VRHGHGMDLSLFARDSVFPLARAIGAGIGPDELRRRLRRGECHRLHHGWFTTADPTDALVRHRLRTVALLEQYDGKAVASHVSALLRLDLPTYEPELSVVHLMAIDPSSRGHRKADLLIHPRPAGPARSRAPRAGSTGLGPEPAMTRVTAVATDWDGPDAGAPALDVRCALPDTRRGTTHAALAIAFAGLADPRAFLVPADAALHGGIAKRDDLVRAVSILDGRPGAGSPPRSGHGPVRGLRLATDVALPDGWPEPGPFGRYFSQTGRDQPNQPRQARGCGLRTDNLAVGSAGKRKAD
jgi:hypothetical protein